jgi:8-amino-7-oxononanoate synthase
LRERAQPFDGLSFCSNDYLGLARTPAPSEEVGAGASRLIVGERPAHRTLEEALSGWLEVDDVLLFSSGYAANVGALSALVGSGDYVVSDALNHASIIDGLRLSRAEVTVVPHLDSSAVEAALLAAAGRRAWVVTETYFSMDADSPNLAVLRALCDRHGAALVVDEAHALGVFGPDGRGLCAAVDVAPDVLVGTLGKAFGAGGAFVAGCQPLITWLWNRARSHVFSTGLSPALAAAARESVARAQTNPSLRARALANAAQYRGALRGLGADVRGEGPIVPWVIGSERPTIQAAEQLRQHDVHVVAIRPPTVPEGTSRLRFSFTARHTRADVERAIEASRLVLEWLPR